MGDSWDGGGDLSGERFRRLTEGRGFLVGEVVSKVARGGSVRLGWSSDCHKKVGQFSHVLRLSFGGTRARLVLPRDIALAATSTPDKDFGSRSCQTICDITVYIAIWI